MTRADAGHFVADFRRWNRRNDEEIDRDRCHAVRAVFSFVVFRTDRFISGGVGKHGLPTLPRLS
jgi:hypothetical protein